MKLQLSIAIVALLALGACKKTEEALIDENVKSPVNSGLKSYFLVKPGSYWLYVNDSNIKDSVAVISLDSGFTTCSGNGCVQYEFFKMGLKRKFNGFTYNYYFSENNIKHNGAGTNGESGQPIYWGTQNISEEFQGLKFIENYSSLKVNGIEYKDVSLMRITAKNQIQNEFDYDTDLYFARYVGIIKKVVYNTSIGTQTWFLTKYEIVK